VDGCNSFELCTPMTLQNTRLLFTGEPGFPVSVLEETSTEINGIDAAANASRAASAAMMDTVFMNQRFPRRPPTSDDPVSPVLDFHCTLRPSVLWETERCSSTVPWLRIQ
jgi:hypothetical protein